MAELAMQDCSRKPSTPDIKRIQLRQENATFLRILQFSQYMGARILLGSNK